jgi:hypothetical protein
LANSELKSSPKLFSYSDLTEASLGLPKYVTDKVFQAGNRVTFYDEEADQDTTYLSYYVFSADLNLGVDGISFNNELSKRSLYKVKLYQQLAAGFRDLTEDV